MVGTILKFCYSRVFDAVQRLFDYEHEIIFLFFKLLKINSV